MRPSHRRSYTREFDLLETDDMRRLQQRVSNVQSDVAATWRYESDDLVLRVDMRINKQDVQFLWHIENLGGPHPGGMHCLINTRLVIVDAAGREAAAVPIVEGERPMCGLEAFFRMRGVLCPLYPLSMRCGLPAGDYTVRLQGTAYDCTYLVLFAESFGDLYHFERIVPVYCRAEAEFVADGTCNSAIDRLPETQLDAELGSFTVDADRTGPNRPNAINELVIDLPDWGEADAQVGPPVSAPTNPADSPEHFWREQIDVMLEPFRELSTCPWGAGPFTVIGDVRERGWVIRSHREHCFYMPTLSAMYRLTGEQKYFAAAWFCYESVRRNYLEAPWGGSITDWTDRVSSHALEAHDMIVPLLEYYDLCGDADVLAPAEKQLVNWPYYEDRHHCQMGRTLYDEREFQDIPIYNMVLGWWKVVVEVGLALENEQLLQQAEDCWTHFLLPGFQPRGFWYYRPGIEPEGAGDHVTCSYDLSMKTVTCRLLCHNWVRALPEYTELAQRGLACCIERFSQRTGDLLLMDSKSNYGEDSPIAQVSRTSALVVIAAYLARYVDDSTADIAAAALRGCNSVRDDPGIELRQWESSQHSGVLANLLSVPLLNLTCD